MMHLSPGIALLAEPPRSAVGQPCAAPRGRPTTTPLGHACCDKPSKKATTCDAGIAMLPDGRVVVTGGVDNRHTSLYDPTADGWVAGPPMNLGRGYQAREFVR